MGFRMQSPTATPIADSQGEGESLDGVEGSSNGGQEDKFSDRFAALSKKERSLFEQEAKFKTWNTEKADYQKQMDEHKAWRQEQEELEKLKDIDPLEYLNRRGLPYDKLTEHVVNRDEYAKDSEYRSLKKEIGGMKEYIEQLKSELSGINDKYSKDKEESQKSKEMKEQQNYIEEIKSFISENSEQYELVAQYGDANDILEAQVEYYQKNGKPAEIADLLEQYEKHLDEQMETQYNKMKGLKKFNSRYGQKDIFEREDEIEKDSLQFIPQSRQNFHGKTLNNSMNSATPTKSDSRRLTREESLNEAAKMIRFL